MVDGDEIVVIHNQTLEFDKSATEKLRSGLR